MSRSILQLRNLGSGVLGLRGSVLIRGLCEQFRLHNLGLSFGFDVFLFAYTHRTHPGFQITGIAGILVITISWDPITPGFIWVVHFSETS